MKVKYLNFIEQWREEKRQLLPVLLNVLDSGQYVGVRGKEITRFEKRVSKECKMKYAVALNSGTDSLTFALHNVGVKRGDEVITPANSYVASTGSIVHLGAKPVFADVLPDQNIDPKEIQKKITKKTKAIMPVHLTGRPCQMDEIIKISKKYNIAVVEDCAQAYGSKYKNKPCGSWGDIGCFSTHPLKNLNGMGDGGFIVTNNFRVAERIRKARNHGLKNRDEMEFFGFVSRMDNIQAAILNFRLGRISKIIKKRRANASYYMKKLNKKYIFFPPEKKYEFNTYHTFIIQVPQRDKLKKYLTKKNISTYIHYPIPIHKQKPVLRMNLGKQNLPVTELQSKQILSLPINHNLKKSHLDYVVNSINNFFPK